MGTSCPLDCFLLSWGINNLWGSKKTEEKQTVSLAIQALRAICGEGSAGIFCELDFLGLMAWKLYRIQGLRKHLELESCWKKVKLRGLWEKCYLGYTLETSWPMCV